MPFDVNVTCVEKMNKAACFLCELSLNKFKIILLMLTEPWVIYLYKYRHFLHNTLASALFYLVPKFAK